MGYRAPNQFFSPQSAINDSDSSGVSKRGGVEFRAFIKWYESLSFAEAVAWTYNAPISEVRLVYWSNTLEDINQALRFKVAGKQLEAVQAYEAFAAVASQALGGGDKDNSVSKAEVKPQNQATTSAQAVQMFKGLFS